MSTVNDGLALEMSSVSLGYGRRNVLAGVDWSVRAGERWFILGRNGAGKTTLLRAVLRELRPRAGTLRWGGDFASLAAIGLVPQRAEINPTLPTTIGEFVTLGLVGLRDAAGRRERFDWALEHAGLSAMRRRSYWELSGGQRQRALLARALIRRPRLLVLDEPTTGLDPAAESTFLDLIRQLNEQEGITMLFVSHRLDTARSYATHAALVQGGGVLTGQPATVLTDAAVSAAYTEGQR